MSEQEIKDMGGRFTALLLQNQKRIYGLILSLVPNGPDADDIMQEACSVMWKKFETFEEGTNFAAWALRIAALVLAMGRQKRRGYVCASSLFTLELPRPAKLEVDIRRSRVFSFPKPLLS